MSVYVDDMEAGFGRMVMCHMSADTVDELHAMADAIGVARKWFQKPDTRPHYDICKSKRALAVQRGAKEIEWRETIRVITRCRAASIQSAAPEGERRGT